MVKRDDHSRARIVPLLVAGLLWAATAVLSVVLIPVVLDLVTRITVAFWGQGPPSGEGYWTVVAVRQLLTVPLAIAAVAIIIGGAEYHTRNANTERSWRLLVGTLSLEIALLLASVMI